MCATVWEDRALFIRDKSLEINGYQANFDNLELGLIYFTHKVEGCYSTMAIKAKEFLDLNGAKRPFERKPHSDECPGYCLNRNKLDDCKVECECAYVRALIGILQEIKHSTEWQSSCG